MNDMKLPFGYGGGDSQNNEIPTNPIENNTTTNEPALTFDSTPATVPENDFSKTQNILDNYDNLDVQPRKSSFMSKKMLILFILGVVCVFAIFVSINLAKKGANIKRTEQTPEGAAKAYVVDVINNKSTSGYFYDKNDNVKLALNSTYDATYADGINTRIVYNPDMNTNDMLKTLETNCGLDKEKVLDEQTVEVSSESSENAPIYVLTYSYNGKYYIYDAYIDSEEGAEEVVINTSDEDTTTENDETPDSKPQDASESDASEQATTQAESTTEATTEKATEDNTTESDYYVEEGYSMYGSDDVGYVILPDYFTDSSEDIAPVDGSEGIAFKDKDNNEIYMIKYSQESSKDNTLKIMAESMTSGVCGNGTEVKVNTSSNGILRNSYVGETTLDDGKFVKVYTFCGNDDVYRSVIFLCDDKTEFEKYYNSYSLDSGIKELKE